MIRLLALLLAASGLAAADGPACRVEAVMPWCWAGGWTPVVLHLSCPVGHLAEVTIGGDAGRVATRIALAPGVAVQRTVLLPPGSASPYGNRLRWTQPDGTLAETLVTPQAGIASVVVVVSSRRVPSERQRKRLALHLPGTNSHHRSSPVVVAPGDLPGLWQGYRRDLVLWLDRGEEARLDPGQRQALQRWAALGGVLVFSDPAEARAWTLGLCRPLHADLDLLDGFDGMDADEHRKAAEERARQQDAEGQAASPPPGTGMLIPGMLIPGMPDACAERAAADLAREDQMAGEEWRALKQAVHDRATSGMEHGDPPGERIPGSESAGGWGCAALALAFALAAGPGLLWWARRRGRPLLLVPAIPACGLAACLGLLAWDLLRHGVELQRSAVELTLVDDARGEHLASTGTTLFGAFAVSCLPLDAGGQWAMRGGLPMRRCERWLRPEAERILAVDWDRGELHGDIVHGRITGHLACTLARPDRRRVAVERCGTGYRVVNSLGTGLRSFTWRDPAGNPWRSAATVADGAWAPLAPGGEEPAPPPLARLPQAANHAWLAATAHAGGWQAKLESPLAPIPGPAALDRVVPAAWACGLAVAGDRP